MKRLPVLLAFASVLACGDDDDGPALTPADGGREGGAPVVRDMDASASPVRVTNVGAACDVDRDCTGALASCAESTLQNVSFAGGYCTASCLSADQCGNGECPFGELVAALGVGSPALEGLTAGQCLQSCTELGQRSSCRDGYVCTTYSSLSPLAVALESWQRPVCLPMVNAIDAGTRDASSDSSATDASAQQTLDAAL
jgi:hypothetical protein